MLLLPPPAAPSVQATFDAVHKASRLRNLLTRGAIAWEAVYWDCEGSHVRPGPTLPLALTELRRLRFQAACSLLALPYDPRLPYEPGLDQDVLYRHYCRCAKRDQSLLHRLTP